MKYKKVVFFQYCLPDFYPPLLNKMEVFENEGWDVKAGIWQTRGLHSNFESKFPGRTIFKIHESSLGEVRLFGRAIYGLRMILHRLKTGPCVWVFTDIGAVIFGAIIAKLDSGSKVIYVEYDCPGDASTLRRRFQEKCRKYVCEKSVAIVIPNERRAQLFNEAVNPVVMPSVVFNVPTKREISSYSPDFYVSPERLNIYYHGSCVPSRLPLSIFDAIATMDTFCLTIRVVKPVPDNGYLDEIQQYISDKNISHKVEILPAISSVNTKLIPGNYDIGLAFFSDSQKDVNQANMWGASNKVFQYMEAGIIPLIYSAEPEFRTNLSEVAMFLDSLKTEELVRELSSFATSIVDLREMKKKARMLMVEKFNFESYFTPIIRNL